MILIFTEVHGNEKVGSLIKEKTNNLIQDGVFRLKKELKFMVGNPLTKENHVRFVDENLNRVFDFGNEVDNYERKRAGEIMQFITSNQDRIEAVIDLHSISLGEGRMLMSYNDPRSLLLANDINLSPVRIIMEPGMLDNTLVWFSKNLEIPSLVVECGNHNSTEAADFGVLQLLLILEKLDCLSISFEQILEKAGLADFYEKISQEKATKEYDIFDKIDADPGFKWEINNLENEKLITAGSLFARSDQSLFIAEEDCYLIMPDPNPKIGDKAIAFLARVKNSTI